MAWPKRLTSTGIQKVVIGVSGGLDSTHALIVCIKTLDRLRLPRTNVLAFTMPGFATSEATRANAWHLMRALGVTAAEIDIKPSCLQMLKDLGHPFADGHEVCDLTFENVQAGERTSHLFRLANYHQALVGGTGDLSELALGWCTYGVGDQMSHYNVNVSVPKTLVQQLIRWVIASNQLDPATNDILDAILRTRISPELIPGASKTEREPAQGTEATIGPFDLQDFHLYYLRASSNDRACPMGRRLVPEVRFHLAVIGARRATPKLVRGFESSERTRQTPEAVAPPELCMLPLRASPSRLDGSPRDLPSALRRQRRGPGRAALHASKPSEGDRMRILGDEPFAEHRNPFSRRAATRAGRSDVVRDSRLNELLLHVADKTPAANKPHRGGLIVHP